MSKIFGLRYLEKASMEGAEIVGGWNTRWGTFFDWIGNNVSYGANGAVGCEPENPVRDCLPSAPPPPPPPPGSAWTCANYLVPCGRFSPRRLPPLRRRTIN